MKLAHITSRPSYELGEKVLGLCGAEFKVKTKWIDLPEDHPICRRCVDKAIEALTEADDAIEFARRQARRIDLNANILSEFLDGNFVLDAIHETDLAHQDEVAQRKQDKAAKKLAKKTCTCTWKTMEDFVVDPQCPIHGGLGEEQPLRDIEDVQLPEPPAVTE